MATTQIVLSPPAGAQIYNNTALANTADVVKSSSGTNYLMNVDNTANGVVSYVKVYYTNAAVTVGTTAPDDIYQIPASTKLPIVPGVNGKAFSSGMQVACVTAGGTAGTTSPVSSVVVTIVYA